LDWHVPRSDAWSKADAMNILMKRALCAIGAIVVDKSKRAKTA